MLGVPQDGNLLVPKFISIADRALAQQIFLPDIFNARQRRIQVNHAGRQDYTSSTDGLVRGPRLKDGFGVGKGYDPAAQQTTSEGIELGAHALQQLWTGHTPYEAWKVMRFGNPLRAAHAIVNDDDVPQETTQVYSCGKAARPRSDN
jgi:hypothetical protein